MTVLARGLKEVYKEFSGVSSYTTGGDNYTFDELNKIEAAIITIVSGGVNPTGDVHYIPELATSLPTTSNTLKIKVYRVSGGTIDETPSGTNLSTVKFGALLKGQ